MTASTVVIEEKLSEYVRSYQDDRCCLMEMLRFLGKHPNTRFSRRALVHALKSERHRVVERGLKYLTDSGVASSDSEKGILLYALAKTGPMRDWALNLARVDWHQWQTLLKEVGD